MHAQVSQEQDDGSDDIFPPNFNNLRTQRPWQHALFSLRNPKTDFDRHWQAVEVCMRHLLNNLRPQEISFNEHYSHVYELCQLADAEIIPQTFRLTIGVLDEHLRSVIKRLTPLKGHRFLQNLRLERDHYSEVSSMICQIMLYLSNMEPMLNLNSKVKGRFDEVVLTALQGKLFRTLAALPCTASAPPLLRNESF